MYRIMVYGVNSAGLKGVGRRGQRSGVKCVSIGVRGSHFLWQKKSFLMYYNF